MPAVGGFVFDSSGAPADREIRVYRRDTGALLGKTRSSGGGGGDPHFDKVSLLLHMDGADGSTAFTDSSGAPIAAVAMGNAKISTAQSVFGGASGVFDGSANTRLDVSSPALSFASDDDFCIEGLMFPSAITTYAYLCGSRTGPENVQLCRVESANGQVISALSGGDVLVSAAVPRDAWGHFALVRASGTLSFYYNGVLQASKASASAFAVTAIGAGYNTPGSQYIDELRITKGAARYTTNFTPPDARFPDLLSAETSLAFGEYSFATNYTGEVQVVCLDDDSAPLENDLILRTFPV